MTFDRGPTDSFRYALPPVELLEVAAPDSKDCDTDAPLTTTTAANDYPMYARASVGQAGLFVDWKLNPTEVDNYNIVQNFACFVHISHDHDQFEEEQEMQTDRGIKKYQ